MQAHIDLTSLLVIAVVVAIVAGVVGFVGPKLSESVAIVADSQYVDQRAKNKLEAEAIRTNTHVHR